MALFAVGSINAQGMEGDGTPMTLNCKYMMTEHLWGSQYTCVGENVVVNTFDTYVTGATGAHMPGKADKDVEAIFFMRQKTTYIPLNFSKPFPNLNAMRVQQSGLTYIDQMTFKGQTQMKYIQLDDNLIEYIPRKTFYGMTSMIWMSLGTNKFRFLYTDMLRGLTELKLFNARNNQIEVIGSSFFRDNTKLELVYFDGNKLRMIGSKLVQLLPGLKLAYFDRNECTNINLEMDPDMNNKLTTEFSQKCAVDCSKAFSTARNTIQEMTNEIRYLNRDMTNNRMEKQSLRFDCDEKDSSY